MYGWYCLQICRPFQGILCTSNFSETVCVWPWHLNTHLRPGHRILNSSVMTHEKNNSFISEYLALQNNWKMIRWQFRDHADYHQGGPLKRWVRESNMAAWCVWVVNCLSALAAWYFWDITSKQIGPQHKKFDHATKEVLSFTLSPNIMGFEDGTWSIFLAGKGCVWFWDVKISVYPGNVLHRMTGSFINLSRHGKGYTCKCWKLGGVVTDY